MDALLDRKQLETIDPLPGQTQPPRKRFVMSPLNKRRWRNFKSHRRGYWSLVIFIAIFLVTLFAELIANDRPIVLSYKG